MKRSVAGAAILLLAMRLYGSGEVTAGGYVPFLESKTTDPAAPAYYLLSGRFAYEPVEDLTVGGDLFFLHGFPEDEMANAVETSCLLGRGRFLLQYDFPAVKIGALTYAMLSAHTANTAKVVYQGPALLGGYRQNYIHEEVYLKAAPVKDLRLVVSAGVNTQSYDVPPTMGGGVLRDTNLFTYGDIGYRIISLVEPFAGLFYGDDLNERETFDSLRFRGGLRGEEFFFDRDLHLSYAAFYKREESEPLHERDRLALYLKGRWNFPTDTDLFGWLYHEYAFPRQSVRYVNRYLALQARQRVLDRKLALSAGGFLLIEKHPGGDWYLPAWPFVEVQAYPVTGLDLRARVHLKFDELHKPSGKWEYGLFQARLEAGGGYFIGGYVQPTVLFFMNLVEGPDSSDSLGLKVLVTAFF